MTDISQGNTFGVQLGRAPSLFQENEMTDISQDNSLGVQLGTHGVLVSVPSALIKAAMAAVGVWLASKGINVDWIQSALGSVIAGGSLASLGLSLHASNQATQAAADSGALKV